MSSLRRLPVVVAIAALLTYSAQAAPERVRDLHYGQVLFHYYQDDYFTALTELLAAQSQSRLNHHVDDGELLRGGLHLGYGLHDEAERIFRRLLTEDTDARTRNRAWYLLARTTYEKGFYDQAARALAEIDTQLDRDLAGDRQLLLALVRMSDQDWAGAVQALEPWDGLEANRPFADYNRAVALVRDGRADAGLALLDELGSMNSEDEELSALRDKANIAAGFTLLEQENPDGASRFLQRVRLDGPQSNEALLLAGMSESAAGRHRQALTPLAALRDRPIEDPAVQHAMLVIPEAHANLGEYAQATTLFEQSITVLENEARRLDSVMERIQSGELIAALALEAQNERSLDAPPIPGHVYLIQLMAAHGFQQVFQNYLDLRSLEDNLDYWEHSMASFDAALDLQRARIDRRLAAVQARIEGLERDGIRARRQMLGEALERVQREGELLALASPAEREHWQRLREVDQDLSVLPTSADTDRIQLRFWMFLGDFVSELEAEFEPRLALLQAELDQVDAAVAEMLDHYERVRQTHRSLHNRLQAFERRLETQRERLATARPQVVAATAHHRDLVQNLALQELRAHRAQIEQRIQQARFALAQVHDRAALATGGTAP